MTLREGIAEEENLERKNLFAKQKIFATISLYFCLLLLMKKAKILHKKLEKLREKIMQKFCEKMQKFHEKNENFAKNSNIY